MNALKANLPAPQESSVPREILELRAAEQRRRLHSTVVELRHTLRERVDLRQNARQHLWPSIGVAALFGLLAGYRAGGVILPRKSA